VKAALKYAGMILAGILAALYAIGRIRQGNRADRAEAGAIGILEKDAHDRLGEANALTKQSKAAKAKAEARKEQAEKALDRLAAADPSTTDLLSDWNKKRIEPPETADVLDFPDSGSP